MSPFLVFNLDFTFDRNYTSTNCRSKSRHFAQHPHAQFKPDPEPSEQF